MLDGVDDSLSEAHSHTKKMTAYRMILNSLKNTTNFKSQLKSLVEGKCIEWYD